MATLSKESFCKALALIKEQDHINDRVSEALELVCGNRVVYLCDIFFGRTRHIR